MSKAMRFVAVWIGMIAGVVAMGATIIGFFYGLVMALSFAWDTLFRGMANQEIFIWFEAVLLVILCGLVSWKTIYEGWGE